MSGDRDGILGRIREALSVPAPRHHATPRVGSPLKTTAQFREWLPQAGATFTEWHAMFLRQCETLRTEFRDCADAAEAAAHLSALASEHGWTRIALHAGEITDAVSALLPPSIALHRLRHGYEKDALEACDAGLTECESLVAQTGSVCVTSPSSGGRALSVLPPHHVVLARRAQLLPDLSAAYEQLAAKYRNGYPSFISFISGPSRTGDIERILVLGAHGPRRLTVLLLP